MPEFVLGAMNFGKRIGEAESVAIMDRAVTLGATLIDTANVYNDGESERIVGRWARGRRDQIRIATKVGLGRKDGRVEGLSRARILAAIDESLERLGTDRVDIYYLHAPDRSQAPPPVEESVAAMAELVRAGKVRAWGISNHASWQILEMFEICDAGGFPRPVISQVLYNFAVRQLEIEYFKFAQKYRLHTTVYNALAGGVLTGRHRLDAPIPAGSRFDKNPMYQKRYWTERLFELAAGFGEVAADEGTSAAELAYAWLSSRPGVDSILIGPASALQLEVAFAGGQRKLSDAAVTRLETLAQEFAGTDASYAR